MDLFFRVIMGSECWKDDITLLPLPWREVNDQGKGLGYDCWSGKGGQLRVGVMWDDGCVRPVTSVVRAMESTTRRLKEVGAELVDLEPRGFEESWDIIVSARLPTSSSRVKPMERRSLLKVEFRRNYITSMEVPNSAGYWVTNLSYRSLNGWYPRANPSHQSRSTP